MEDEQLRALIAEHLGVGIEAVQMQSDFEKDLGADSLDTADLLMAAREQYRIKLTEDDIKKIRTVQDLADLIASQEKK
jgi:acyl carrier protein